MQSRRRILIVLSATLFVANLAFAAEPTPTMPAKGLAFSGLTLCHDDPLKAEVCCAGKIIGVGAEPAIVRVETVGQCQTREGDEPPIAVKGESFELKPASGAISFAKVCTAPPTDKECPAAQEVQFAPVVQLTVEQPKGTVVLDGIGVVFP